VVNLYQSSAGGLVTSSRFAEVLSHLKRELVLRASELTELSLTRTQIRRLVEEGIIIEVGAGFYAHPSLDPFVASVIAVAKHYPEGVISNRTALVIHELSDERVDRIDIDIPRSRSIRNRLVHQHRVSDAKLVGDSRIEFHGQNIRILDRERSLSEAYLIDPNGLIFIKAVKRYLSKGSPLIDKIAQYDALLKTSVLRAVAQEMADE
jgi:predicted transcriptional regulator of viral defense system